MCVSGRPPEKNLGQVGRKMFLFLYIFLFNRLILTKDQAQLIKFNFRGYVQCVAMVVITRR